jgi:glycosyltransferase involved in cell wall biosynthesis
MKILMSAYACRPGAGSEPGAGWAFASSVAKRHDVWLLTRRDNGPDLEAELRRQPELRVTPVYVDLPKPLRTRSRSGPRIYLYYPAWQAVAARCARRLHERVGFDVAHHVTYATDWMPAGLAAVPGVPLVWGPVGGYAPPPWPLWRWLGPRGIAQEVTRTAGTGLARRLVGDHMARSAALLVAQNDDVARRFVGRARHLVVEPHVAVTLDRMPVADTPPRPLPRRAVFVGRLLPWKGLAVAIAALGQPSASDWTLDVYGEGPDRRRCDRLAIRMGVSHRVRFHGRQPRPTVLESLRRADALLFPSMHDSGGFAVGEALALGCPVVCLDRGGPAMLVQDGWGTKVPVAADTVIRLAGALAEIEGRLTPVHRWDADRLADYCDRWYAQAIAAAA